MGAWTLQDSLAMFLVDKVTYKQCVVQWQQVCTWTFYRSLFISSKQDQKKTNKKTMPSHHSVITINEACNSELCIINQFCSALISTPHKSTWIRSSARRLEGTPTDFTDGDDFQTLFVCSCSTARAVVALIEDAPGEHTQKHTHTHTH